MRDNSPPQRRVLIVLDVCGLFIWLLLFLFSVLFFIFYFLYFILYF
jgi:hypothetical protein